MTKILLIGHYGFTNRGCEAIVRGTLRIILESIRDARFKIISTKADFDREVSAKSKMPLDAIHSAFGDFRRGSAEWFVRTAQRRLFGRGVSQYNFLHRKLYKESDIVISVGGDNFSDDYGSPAVFFDMLDCAREQGAATVIWGASIGPFHQDEKKWADAMKKLDLITVREPMSFEYLKGLGVSSNVMLVADPAFLMAPAAPPAASFSATPGARTIGLGLSGLLYTRQESRKAYTDASVDLIRHIRKEMRAPVMLVPHVTDRGAVTNDAIACEEIRRLAGEDAEVTVLEPGLNAAELKYAIATCEYFVGARTHSTIASLSTGVPTLSIGYSRKAYGINEQLYSTQDFVLPIEGITGAKLIAAFQKLVAAGPELRRKLDERLPEIRRMSQEAGDCLAKLAKKKKRSA